MSTEPTFLTIRAREVKPYHYAMWTSTGGEPFANCICGIKWSDGGKDLWFMLESRNYYKTEADALIEVVDICDNPVWEQSRKRYADWTLPTPPVPRYDHAYRWSADGPECDVCGSVHQPNLEPLEAS
jgi:hypothetical protein